MYALDREDAFVDKGMGGQCGKGWVGIKGNCRRGKGGKAGGRRMTDIEKARSLKMAQSNRAARPTKQIEKETPITPTRKMNSGSALVKSSGGGMTTVKQRAIADTQKTIQAASQLSTAIRGALASPQAQAMKGAIAAKVSEGAMAAAGAAGRTAGKGFAMAMANSKKKKKR